MDVNKIAERQLKAFLDIVILAILNGGSTHGYKIIEGIHKEFEILLSPGSLCPLLGIHKTVPRIKPQVSHSKLNPPLFIEKKLLNQSASKESRKVWFRNRAKERPISVVCYLKLSMKGFIIRRNPKKSLKEN